VGGIILDDKDGIMSENEASLPNHHKYRWDRSYSTMKLP